MTIAKHVVRFSATNYNPKQIEELSLNWGEFVYRTSLGICFASERFFAVQEYLVEKHKIKNGFLIVQTGKDLFEINRVSSSFIEDTQSYSTAQKSLQTIIADELPIDRSAIKVVLRCDKSLRDSVQNINVIHDFDEEDIPEKYEYTLASIAAKQNVSKTKPLIIGATLLLACGAYYLPTLFESEEVAVKQEVVDPFQGFYRTLNGGSADIRSTMLVAKKLMTDLDSLPQWQYTQINLTGNGGSMMIAAEVTPIVEGDQPQKVMLIDAVGREGYSIDLQQQNPVVFTNNKNKPVFDKNYESVPLVNLDQSIAYLTDAVGTLVENTTLHTASSQVSQVSGSYKQKDIQLIMNGNYHHHLDYLSIIFSGWPVVMQSGRIEHLGKGKYRAQFNLAILGE